MTTTWSVLSGPGTVTFGDAAAVDTTVTFGMGGVYVLRLTADDGAVSSSDDVMLAVNQAPTVNAGVDQVIVLGDAAVLDGTISDDGLPNPPGALTTTWSVLSGPGTVIFGDAAAVDTTVTFNMGGIYVLRLTADDGALSSSDDVMLAVNQAAAVNAGVDQVIVLGDAAVLDGTISDDGLPNPPGAVTTAWSVLSGPGTATFGDAAAVDTTAVFTGGGVYVLRLTASDGALTSSEDVTISVNQPPAVNAGVDQSLVLGVAAVLDGTIAMMAYRIPPVF